MDKKLIFACVISAAVLFSGCEQKEDKQENAKIITSDNIVVTKDVVKEDATEEIAKGDGGQFYYSYNKEKNATQEDSFVAKANTTLDAYLKIKSPYEKVQITMMIKGLSKNYVVKCSACHDDYANGIIGPSLLDKDKNFIYERIMDFKNGKRTNILMKELVMQISDKELGELAGEIADFNKELKKMRESR